MNTQCIFVSTSIIHHFQLHCRYIVQYNDDGSRKVVKFEVVKFDKIVGSPESSEQRPQPVLSLAKFPSLRSKVQVTSSSRAATGRARRQLLVAYYVFCCVMVRAFLNASVLCATGTLSLPTALAHMSSFCIVQSMFCLVC